MTTRRALRSPFLVLGLAATAACASSSRPGEDVGATNAAVTEKCGASPGGAVQGRDVSDYQGAFDWKGTGVAFGYARVSDGVGFLDDQFDGNWSRMKDAGIRRGAYQFFEPSQSATDQANLVVKKVGKLGAGDLPAMIDIEVTDGASPGEMASAIRTWLEVVERGTGLRPIIYTGSYFWEDNVGATDFGDYPIWIAAYGPPCPSLPAGWSNWTFWQYSDGGGALDHDVFNGSLADLEKLEGGGRTTPPSAEPLFTTAVARNADNRLEVFARGGKDAAYHQWQKSAGGGWAPGWGDLGGELVSDVTVAENLDGRLEAFGVGTNKAVFHKWQESPGGGWSGWDSLGGELTSDVAVVRDSVGRLQAFARGTNDELYVIHQTAPGAGWTGWESLGGKITSNPSVAMNADGRLEVFARGASDVPYHQWQREVSGTWSGWYGLGGAISSDATAVTDAEGKLEVFAVGTNGEVYRQSQKSPGGEWTGWGSLGGKVTSNVAVARNADGRLEVFARGTNDAMFHAWEKSPGGAFTGWASLGGNLTSHPSVGVNGDGRLELFARGTNGALFHTWQETAGGAWSSWDSLGGWVR